MTPPAGGRGRGQGRSSGASGRGAGGSGSGSSRSAGGRGGRNSGIPSRGGSSSSARGRNQSGAPDSRSGQAPGRRGQGDRTHGDQTRAGQSRAGRADRGDRGDRAPHLEAERQSGGDRGGRQPGGPRGLGGDLVEGRQAVRELLLAGRRRVVEVLMANDLDDAPILDDIVELAREQRVTLRELSRTKLHAAARTDAPQGVIARAAPLPDVELERLARRRGGQAPFLLAVDGVTDPGNLGALLRSAECAGVTGLVLPRHRAVHVTPTVAKAAAGAIEHVPMTIVGGLPTALARLTDLGVWVVGLDSGGDRTVHDVTFADEPVVLVLGAEGRGLSRLVRQRCDAVVSIPLRGRLSSLNVAAAGAVACFEVARQRAASVAATPADIDV